MPHLNSTLLSGEEFAARGHHSARSKKKEILHKVGIMAESVKSIHLEGVGRLLDKVANPEFSE